MPSLTRWKSVTPSHLPQIISTTSLKRQREFTRHHQRRHCLFSLAKPVKISVARARFPCMPLRHAYSTSCHHHKNQSFQFTSYLENKITIWSYWPFNKHIQLIFTFQIKSDWKWIAELQKHARKLLSETAETLPTHAFIHFSEHAVWYRLYAIVSARRQWSAPYAGAAYGLPTTCPHTASGTVSITAGTASFCWKISGQEDKLT